jgi:hypothetical protein
MPGGTGAGEATRAADAEADPELPRRVKQANLAPQLRASPPQRQTTVVSAGPASGPTPAEIRRTMSALQRGWQEGRSQQAGSPPPPAEGMTGPSRAAGTPGGPDGAGSSPGGGDRGADEEVRGNTDGI